jgi:gentisate 1,2-dioxygenase
MADDGLAHTVDREAEKGRMEFYGRASDQHLAPLWRVLGGLVLDQPKSPCVPAQWKWSDIRPYLMEACGIISAAEAERRVLVLENPGMKGESRITRSLFAGMQIILPGEIAPAHRHVASALRFVIEGSNAYTAVSGERTMMAPGDFVITPSWTWHDHGNLSDKPMVWLDGLDMHLVNIMDAGFREAYPDTSHPIKRPEGAAEAEFGYNMMPVGYEATSQTTPIFNYPYARTREALDRLARFHAIDACFGYKMKYINPVDGGWAMPTISTWMQLLPKDFKSMPYRSTDSVIFVCVEGHGKTIVGSQTFDWGPHDVWTVPSWQFYEHVAATDAVIFSFSDRVAQEKLDFFREQRGNA